MRRLHCTMLAGIAVVWWGTLGLGCVYGAEAGAAPSASPKVKFAAHRIGTFRNEACNVGDFNGDGKLDIIAGPFVYLAPDWKPQKVREIAGQVDDQGKGYYWEFMNEPLDVDGDGRLDVVTCSWTGEAEWYQNVGFDRPWPKRLIEKIDHFECGDLWDIDGDGRAAEILPHAPQTFWYEAGKLPDGQRGIIKHMVSASRKEWGGGVGDVNGDGRPDILRPDAWYEAPADPRRGQWMEHPLAVGAKEGKAEHTPQILVYDVNADGLPDIVTSSAHRYGIFWYQQVRQGDTITWKQHTIDDTWTQAHSLTLADLDQDGDLDLVTGKRFMAHNGNDPDAFGPLGVYWYELQRGPNPRWIRHAISFNEKIGAGMNIPAVDLDGDGDLDVIVTGKWGGPVWFENKMK